MRAFTLHRVSRDLFQVPGLHSLLVARQEGICVHVDARDVGDLQTAAGAEQRVGLLVRVQIPVHQTEVDGVLDRHEGLVVHELLEGPPACLPGALHDIAVDDARLHAVEEVLQLPRALVVHIAREGCRLVDHELRHRRGEDLRAGAGDRGGRAGRQGDDVRLGPALELLQHAVDLEARPHVAAGAVHLEDQILVLRQFLHRVPHVLRAAVGDLKQAVQPVVLVADHVAV